MKKIFTCISLAAATFMATTPVMAQQQKQPVGGINLVHT